jgi:hypothetical protein
VPGRDCLKRTFCGGPISRRRASILAIVDTHGNTPRLFSSGLILPLRGNMLAEVWTLLIIVRYEAPDADHFRWALDFSVADGRA